MSTIDPRTLTLTLDGPRPTPDAVGRVVLGLPAGEYRMTVQDGGIAIWPAGPRRLELVGDGGTVLAVYPEERESAPGKQR